MHLEMPYQAAFPAILPYDTIKHRRERPPATSQVRMAFNLYPAPRYTACDLIARVNPFP